MTDTNFKISTATKQWQWMEWEGLSYLSCTLLSGWQHGFFTSQFEPHLPETLVDILSPNASMYRVKQVHGKVILAPSEITTHRQNTESYPPGDGAITEKAEESVWVASADCTPALIGDLKTGRCAAVHSGWRGTAQKIVPEAINYFIQLGSSLGDLRIALGPAISGEVYQVSEEVAAQVGKSILTKAVADTPEAILAAIEGIYDSPILPDPQPGRRRLDVRRVNELQLEQMGIKSEQIAIAPYCTYQTPSHFHSYRRTKAKKVQWSGIVSKNELFKPT